MPGRTTRRGCGSAYQKSRRLVIARDRICTECHRRPSAVAHHEPPLSERSTRSESADLEKMRGVCPDCHGRLTAALRERRRPVGEELGPAAQRGMRGQRRRVWEGAALSIRVVHPADVSDSKTGEVKV
jgi:hypothetical protein